jgi:hypothetical protein
MTNLLERLRIWLIIKLAGKSTVVINAHFINGGMVIDTVGSIIKDTTIEVNQEQSI